MQRLEGARRAASSRSGSASTIRSGPASSSGAGRTRRPSSTSRCRGDRKGRGSPESFTRRSCSTWSRSSFQHPGQSFDWSRPPMPRAAAPGAVAVGRGARPARAHGPPHRRRRGWCSRRRRSTPRGSTSATFSSSTGRPRASSARCVARASSGRCGCLSWAVELGCVRDGDRVLRWKPAPMLAPLHADLTEIFEAKEYAHAGRRAGEPFAGHRLRAARPGASPGSRCRRARRRR